MKNLQLIEVKHLGATNNRGARIKITDTRFKVSITLARDYAINADEQAIRYLTAHGFNIVAKVWNEITEAEYLLMDNFTPINQTPYAVTNKYNKELIK